ncbi:arginyl-tRNA--protein transferase 1-like [Ornithodoros turicata]|uniref:arginyl-tRNA--protein transferase 1-like n=1 Tax=Ornithodoros turicata TaxID=34597 RepID=UPI003138C8BE
MGGYSIVEYFYEHKGHKCGYCKSASSSFSCGMWAHILTPEVYDKLLDRGWRRSGKYCYKPIMKKTCCRQYPIKLDVSNFRLSNSQKKTLKKMHRFLATGERSKTPATSTTPEDDEGMGDTFFEGGEIQKRTDISSDICIDDVTNSSAARVTQSRTQTSRQANTQSAQHQSTKESSPKQDSPRKGQGPDPSKPKCMKAKELRKQRKLQKLALRGETSLPEKKKIPNSTPKSLEDYLNEPLPENPAHRLKVVTVRSCPPSPEFDATLTESWKVYESYQMQVHKDPKSECDKERHRRFLVDSPLQHEANAAHGFGSFHQQYWLDNELIAVGVIDILPTCVSSVYLYYKPDYGFLSLGTYATLWEIAFTRELRRTCPGITRYCMGFYIHSCPKMRYKGNFSPSYLLCPETYTWHPIEKCKPLLDRNKYARFEEDEARGDEDRVIDVDEVLILFLRKLQTYRRYAMVTSGEDREEVEEYATLVGRECTESVLLYRSST